ncbi:Gfo/Idh/MocA family protein [Jonesia denitrificans]|uniref:Oxidoreductase domain protein n=1 Tax=Jonesia denitrificans (strain ATCC 14870 / DSM 20603 / BCRC 15368 / CIP 55.134 / JCM 11481 / NBRC 15587 / NCTC 10816 / Prevot 55134) TaxID=471856 RepID=C7R4V8_JONDD|nr:Gfo/Idh/MocA family oxidoreductase [Jonesia denitrificans]ACV09128.1 oxidoreductase domain protein [Jonesia denitrificans DSM 20603]AVJ53329.1 gfo/Idh/MocA family oxidoreductase [Jonesia denitrificans]QXB44132.1 Gfo/Idh/MocA family oxidoreductase [Jonesia denitrificans]SQH21337.1 Uncharacterized oxidoreductase yvaA [Jonesia denitrificans]
MTTLLAQPIRAALVGYGMAGGLIHSPLMREAGWQVTAVVTNNTERRAQVGEDWPKARTVGQLSDLLKYRDDFDVVVVVSPSHLHAEHVHTLIGAGIPTIVDKPLAVSAAQATQLVDHASQENVPLTVFQNRRWDSEQLTLTQLLTTGELGQVHTFERRWERWRPQPKNRWKENDPASGGLLQDLGAHLVDSAVHLFGPVTTVYATARHLSTAAYDDVFISLTHASGVISRLWAGSMVGAPGPRTRVLGTKGAYVVTDFESEPTAFAVRGTSEGGAQGWVAHGESVTAVPAAKGGHGDFYRLADTWLRGEGPAPVDPRDAVTTAQILDAAQDSALNAQVVQLAQSNPDM